MTSVDREKKTIKTDAGHEIVLKTYLTARELRAVQMVYASSTEFDRNGQPIKIQGDALYKTQDELVRQGVISVDGKTENCFEAMMDFPQKEFDQIFIEVEKLAPTVVADKKKEQS